MSEIDRSSPIRGTAQDDGLLARLLPAWSVIPIITGLFIWAFSQNIGYLNVDDLIAIVSGNPAEAYAVIDLQDGRHLLAAAILTFNAIGLDGLRDYTVFAVLYAFVFAWFCQAAVAYVARDSGLRPEIVRVWTILSGTLLLTHGFFSELIAWKIAYHVMLVTLVPVTLCLRLLARQSPTPRLCLELAGLMLIINMTYQPGATAVLFLTFAWILVTALSPGGRAGRTLGPYLAQVGMVVAAYVAAGVGYVIVTHVIRAVSGIGAARPFALVSLHQLPNHIYLHITQIIGMFDPTGVLRGTRMAEPQALIALALVAGLAWLAFRRGNFVPVWAGLVGLSLLLTNPQNLLLMYYVPSDRSSFYIGFFLPVLLIAAHASGPSPRWKDRIVGLTVVVLALQVAWFLRQSSEQIELQRREFAFARLIVNTIDADPTTRNAPSVRLPRTPPPGIYQGLHSGMGRTTSTIFEWTWGISALLTYASGRKLTYVGYSNCPAARSGPLEFVLRREGDTIEVCY
jgi:hypothetical protein